MIDLEWFGPWAMDDIGFALQRRLILEVMGRSPFGNRPTAPRVPVQKLDNGIAMIELRGTLSKGYSPYWDSTSTVAIIQAVRKAVADSDVSGIMFIVDSGGGTVAGTNALFDAIAAATAKKPTAAFLEDLAASAAYWSIAGVGAISMNAAGLTGSLGTILTITDYSKQYEKAGMKVHVVKSGALKGVGTPGTVITQDQLDYLQRTVTGLNAIFKADVAKGRRFSGKQLDAAFTGEMFVGEEAKQVGLVDSLHSLDDALQQLSMRIRRPQ